MKRFMTLVERFGFWVSDHANPMLVRCVRQELRSRGFLGLYLLMLIAATVMSVIYAELANATVQDDEPIGFYLFTILCGAWGFIVLPWQATASLRIIFQERQDDTWDLVELSPMRPRDILFGLLQAVCTQGMLYTFAIAPFMLMAYLLRGIDIYSIVISLIIMVLAGTATAAFGILAGCLSKTKKASRGFLTLLVFGGSCTLLILILSLIAQSQKGYGFNLGNFAEELLSGDGDAWLVVLIIANIWIAWMTACLVFGGTILLHRAANRSTGPRLLWIGLTINSLIWIMIAVIINPYFHFYEGLSASALLLICSASFLGAFSTTEDDILSPRQARSITEARGIKKVLMVFFGPGYNRGCLAFTTLLTSYLAVVILNNIIFSKGTLHGSNDESEILRFGLVLMCYVCIYYCAADVISRKIFHNFITTPYLRRAILLGLILCAGLLFSLCGYLIGGRFDKGNFFFHLSPFTGISYIMVHPLKSDILIGVLSLLGITSFAYFILKGLRLRIHTARVLARDDEHNPRGD